MYQPHLVPSQSKNEGVPSWSAVLPWSQVFRKRTWPISLPRFGESGFLSSQSARTFQLVSDFSKKKFFHGELLNWCICREMEVKSLLLCLPADISLQQTLLCIFECIYFVISSVNTKNIIIKMTGVYLALIFQISL